MYRVTVSKKESYENVVLEYEIRTDAFLLIESVFAGDLKNNYECKVEIVNEESNNDVD